MGENKYRLLNREFVLAVLFLAIGIAAAVSVPFIGVKGLNIGLFCGFFPTGLGCLIIELKARKSADLQKKAEIKNEERNVFIRNKAGHRAFWLSYGAIFLLWLATLIKRVDAQSLIIFLLFFMPIIYFSALAACNRRY